MAIEKPRTQKEMLYQLWYAVIGSNGDGINSRIRRLEESSIEMRDVLTKHIAARGDTCPQSGEIKELKNKLERNERMFVKTFVVGVAVWIALTVSVQIFKPIIERWFTVVPEVSYEVLESTF